MAGDWIKVEASTPHKPEIFRIARGMNVTVDDAFGKAIKFWIWIDSVTVDGRVDGVTSTDVDAVVGADGFAQWLQVVGWLKVNLIPPSIEVPNFDDHNGETAKARALKTKRQARWRKNRVDGVASTSASTSAPTREEKRENTILLAQIPEGLKKDGFPEQWEKWLLHCQHVKGQIPSQQQQEKLLMDCLRSGVETSIRNIRFSIEKGAKNILDGSKPKPNGKPDSKPEDTMPPSFEEFRKIVAGKGRDEH